MALIFFEGFDSEDETYESTFFTYVSSSSGVDFNSAYGRVETRGLRFNDSRLYNETKIHATFLDDDTIILGMALRFTATPNESDPFTLQFRDGVVSHATIKFTASGAITVAGSSSPPVSFPIGEYFYFEVKIKFSPTVGTIEIRIDGDPVLALTGIDTQATANSYFTTLFFINDNSTYVYSDDWYCCNSLGTKNNDFLGDVKVITLRPTADGTYSEFTPSEVADHYTLVDEELADSADYITGDTTGQRDSFTVPMLGSGRDIHGVSVSISGRSSDANTVDAKGLIRQGGADYTSTAQTMSDVTRRKEFVFDQDPSDNADWTDAKINSAEFGIEVA